MATHAPARLRTTATRLSLVSGAVLACVAGALVLALRPHEAALAATASGVLLLIGGHRANHGAGEPLDRMLDELLDRLWDVAILAPIAWAARDAAPHISAGALVALGASFVSSYVRARGAALRYTVEESHVTRGIRYALIAAGLGFGWLRWSIWVCAFVAFAAAIVRTSQVAKEERS
jgi:hypothetical protein